MPISEGERVENPLKLKPLENKVTFGESQEASSSIELRPFDSNEIFSITFSDDDSEFSFLESTARNF